MATVTLMKFSASQIDELATALFGGSPLRFTMLAAKVGVGEHTVRSWISGRRSPKWEHLHKLTIIYLAQQKKNGLTLSDDE